MSIKPVADVLEQLIEVHARLFELAQVKTPVLVKNNVDELNSIVSKERKLIMQLNALDSQRIQATGEYLVSRGYVPDPRVSVSELIRLTFKADEKAMLQDLQQKLLQSIADLRSANELNQQLIQQSLAFIDYSLDLLIDSPDDGMIYRNPNHQSEQAGNSAKLFDSKA